MKRSIIWWVWEIVTLAVLAASLSFLIFILSGMLKP
jgi:hypothetical protein